MNVAETAYLNQIREQLVVRRQSLETALHRHETKDMMHLLHEVDQALGKLETGTFGVCQSCHDSIEVDRLMADPLVSLCLGCLTPAQQRALEHDLELAARMQNGLLPTDCSELKGWCTAFHYRPARIVSGDYCDLVSDERGGVYFILADVAGKGVGAAMLTASLRAVFRALIPTAECVGVLLEKANRLFCESAMSGQFATLVFGHLTQHGDVQLVNAGHLPVLIARDADVELLESTDLPFGMFCSQQFTVQNTRLNEGDTLILYTDGICEAQNEAGEEFGIQALRELIREHKLREPSHVVEHCKTTLDSFRGSGERLDDETLMVIQLVAAQGMENLGERAYAKHSA